MEDDLAFLKERVETEHNLFTIHIKLLRGALRAVLAKGLITKEELISGLYADAENAKASGADPQCIEHFLDLACRVVQGMAVKSG